MSLNPRNYQEALARKLAKPQRPRKGLQRSAFVSKPDSASLNGKSLPRASGASKKASGKRLRARIAPKLVAWSRKVRERDDYTCQVTGIRDVENNIAHHRAPRGRRPDLRYSIDNGITVTQNIHHWIHFINPTEATKLGLLSNETYEKAMKG